MKVSCPSCPQKYNISDDKVTGKVVKMRCRKCGATIVIDGASQAAANVPAPEPEAPPADEGWTVNVDDGDQRTMSSEEVVQAFAARVIDEETFLWKDGMADWLPLKEVPELWDLCGSSGGVQTSGPTQVSAPTFPESNFGGGFSSFTGNGGGADTTEQALFDGGNLGQNPGASDALFGSGAETPAPASALGGGAARRAGGRGVGADLFGGISKAGGDEDGGLVAAIPKDTKLTGARNENSVLFSLSALTENKDAPASATTATTEGSGLIDIRALSASASGAPKESRVDDIMNLGGGGAFTPALTAPVLAPVSPDAMGDFLGASSGEAGAPGNKKMMYIIAGLVGLILVMFVVLIVSLTSKSEPVEASKDTKDSKATRTATSVAAVPTVEPAATTEPTAAPTATGAAPKAPNVGSGGTGATAGGTKVATAGGATKKAATDEPKEPAATAAPTPPANPGNFEDMMRKAAGKGGEVVKTTTTTSVAAPFDRGAAAASIGGIAGTLQSCKRGDPGAGRAKITFDPATGSAKAVEIIEGPFSGTPTGGCVAGKFRGAKIPPFAPPEQSVVKSFSIN